MVSEAKSEFRYSADRPAFVSQETWNCWLRYWDDPNVEAKSQQASKNRRSDSLGDGSGVSKHTGGSRSAVAHAKVYREEHGKDPTVIDTFILTHMRKDGTYVDEKSKRIAEDVESRISAAKEAGEEADVTKIFMGAVGGVKKQCLYGTGSLKHKYVDFCSTSSSLAASHVESASLRTQVEQLTQQLAERDAKLEERMLICSRP